MFCRERGLPLEKMRFFTGQDDAGLKVFGIYKDESGNYVVYKNKADYSRTVLYRGTDETYAVNEIVHKMRSEVQIRKSGAAPAVKAAKGSGCFLRTLKLIRISVLVLFAVATVLVIFDKLRRMATIFIRKATITAIQAHGISTTMLNM